MKDRILIEKNLIPYRFSILLGDELFDLDVNYNRYADMFTVALYKGDELICAGEPIVYGVPLFKDVFMPNYPAITIIPIDESGEANRVTKANLGDTVFLCIDDEGGSDE